MNSVIGLCFFLVNAFHCTEVYISAVDGEDDIDCGSLQQPCRTFETLGKLITKVTSPSLVVYVDGGEDSSAPLIYNIQHSVLLTTTTTTNTTITRFPRNNVNPVIQGGSAKLFPAFQLYNSVTKTNLKIELIDFREINILLCKDSLCNVQIVNSRVFISGQRLNKNGVIYISTMHSSFVLLLRCKFVANSHAVLVRPRNQNSTNEIRIQFTHFKGSSVYFFISDFDRPGMLSKLTLDHVTFTSCKWEPVKIIGLLDTLELTNTEFLGNHVEIRSSYFSPDLVSINNKRHNLQRKRRITSIRIENVIVRKNHASFTLFQQCNHADVSNVTFSENNFTADVLAVGESSNVVMNTINFSKNIMQRNTIVVKNVENIIVSKLNFQQNLFRKKVLSVTSSQIHSLSEMTFQKNVLKHRHSNNPSAFSFNSIGNLTLGDLSIMFASFNCKLFHTVLCSRTSMQRIQVFDSQLSTNIFHDYQGLMFNMHHLKIERIKGQMSELLLLQGESYSFSNISIHQTTSEIGLRFQKTNSTVSTISVTDCHFKKDVLLIEGGNISLEHCRILSTHAETLFTSIYFSKLLKLQHLSFMKNNIRRGLIYTRRATQTMISYLYAIENDINNGTAFLYIFSTVILNDIHVVGNIYQTGVSLTNCDTTITTLHMENNTAFGPVREFYYSEYFNLALHEKIAPHERCWKIVNRELKMTDVYIVSNQKTPSQHISYAIALFLLTPKLNMKNVSLGLINYQKYGFEMFIYERESKHLKPDIIINCPTGASPRITNDRTKELSFKYQVFCQPCTRNFYSLQRGAIHINNVTEREETNGKRIIDHINAGNVKNVQCEPCSVGGICDHGFTKSQGNFYGYTEKKEKKAKIVRYVACPARYCCSGRGNAKCRSHNSCMSGREGILCGNCQKDYQESFFDTTCMLKRSCTSKKGFWFVYLLTIFLAILVVCSPDTVYLMTALKHKIITKYDINDTLSLQFHNPLYPSDDGYLAKETKIDCEKKEYQRNESNDNKTCGTGNKMHHNNSDVIQTCAKFIMQNKYYISSSTITSFVCFYQMRSLINLQDTQESYFSKKLTEIFNGEMFLQFATQLCPYSNLGAVDKIFFLYLFYPLAMISMLILSRMICEIIERFCNKQEKSLISVFKNHLEECYGKVLIFNLKSVAFFCFTSLNCVKVQEKSILFINGNVQCFQTWQYPVLIILIFWVVPFPIVFSYVYILYKKYQITSYQYMVCLACPISVFWYRYKLSYNRDVMNCGKKMNNNIAERSLEQKMFRSCRFEYTILVYWECWRMLQRLLLTALAVFIVNPLFKVAVLLPCLVLFAVVYAILRPFKGELWILHWIEVTSLLGLFMLILQNILKAFLYVHSVTDTGGVEVINKILSYFEILLSPVVVSAFLLMGILTFNYVVKKK